MSKLFIPSKYCTEEENHAIKDQIHLSENNGMQGYVAVIHETKDGKREILPPTHNHIVLTGRRWVMQSCMHQNFSQSVQQKDWRIYWFGVGNGGALAATPAIPLDTADTVTDLTSKIRIKPLSLGSSTSDKYSDDTYKKAFYSTTGEIAELSYSESRGEVMMLLQLQLNYDDCPYEDPNLSASINELGIYISPTNLTTVTDYCLFSRYCRPTIYKTNGDSYTFLWYIYF